MAPGLHGLGRKHGRIGLLGGSFNPAHDGHLHVSKLALKHLKLDAVWWLVSPQNPLKPVDGMASFDARLATAKRAAKHPRVHASDFESRTNTRFTADTIAKLQMSFPTVDFVWLMGADNLIQLPRWQRWDEIAARVPIAVFGRPAYSVRAMVGKAAQRYAHHRVSPKAAGRLASCRPPAWAFFSIRLHSASATALRAAGKVASVPGGTEL